MDSARQIIRWSIPGAALLISAATAYLWLRWSAGDSLNDASAAIQGNLDAATGIALSIPLGFMAYQIYYLTYTPRRRLGVVAASRGEAIIKCLTDEQREKVLKALDPILSKPVEALSEAQRRRISPLKWKASWGIVSGDALLNDAWSSPLTLARGSWRTRLMGGLQLMKPHSPESDAPNGWPDTRDRDAVATLYHERWVAHHMISSILLDSTAFADCPGELKADSTAISDIYHAQGAVRTAVVVGVAAGLGAAGATGHTELSVGFVAGVWVLLLTVLSIIWLLSRVRGRLFRLSAVRQGHGLRLLYAQQPDLIDHLDGGGPADAA